MSKATFRKIDGSAIPQPISAETLPLPVGAATALNQTLLQTSLSAIEPRIPAALGQTTMAASLPVVIASNQSTVPVSAASLPLPAGAATLAEQQTQTTSLSVMDDWDESDRAKVNIIVGQGGVQGGSGVVTANTQRTVLATDIALPIGDNRIGRIKITDDISLATINAALLSLKITEAEEPTFTVYASNITIGNNKSMLSIVNTGGSLVNIRIKELRIINTQTTSVTGVIADFNLFRITGHSVGTLLTPQASDTSDAINASISVRTGATVAGEVASILRRWLWSSDEFGPGPADAESADHALQNVMAAYKPGLKEKPLTIRAGEGLTIKQVINSTAGQFDIMVVFTQVAV